MTALRRLLAPTVSLSLGLLMVAAVPSSSSARTVDELCREHTAIPYRALPHLAVLGCSLTGRTVYAGRVSVVVPPAGMSVSGDGIGTHGEVAGLRVENTGTVVRAYTGAQRGAAPSITARANPPACQDRTFHLEHHHWTSPYRYHIKVATAPKRFHKSKLVKQIKKANANMRLGRNTCGKPRLGTPPARYLGRTKIQPNIKAGASQITCGRYNTKNVVGFGKLPNGLLGWTCYWWVNSGSMGAADIMIDNSDRLSTNLPANCTDTWDFEGIVTHEFGHAYGMAHTGSGHANLTMQHEATPCSTYARTLGLGDWLGMRKMYGRR
jgi:hypothetical protein